MKTLKKMLSRLDLLNIDNLDDDSNEKIALEKFENLLNSIRLDAKSSLDERGVNILHLSFGSLVWKESDVSDIEIISPIFIMPVFLKRENSLKPYYLGRFDSSGENLILNPTLLHKLKGDFGITFPKYDLNSDEFNITNYLNEVNELIKVKKGWSVKKETFMAFFSFNKMVIYNDFEKNADKIIGHPLVQKLAGAFR